MLLLLPFLSSKTSSRRTSRMGRQQQEHDHPWQKQADGQY
jgi:hypothetical protein